VDLSHLFLHFATLPNNKMEVMVASRKFRH
jgi:hypothetical protein